MFKFNENDLVKIKRKEVIEMFAKMHPLKAKMFEGHFVVTFKHPVLDEGKIINNYLCVPKGFDNSSDGYRLTEDELISSTTPFDLEEN